MDRYIDAELYKEELRRRQNRPDAQHLSFYIGVQIAIDLVDRAPEVELAPVTHAHWRWMRNHDVICSKCQYVLPSGSPVSDFRFCPHCGAKMDGDETS